MARLVAAVGPGAGLEALAARAVVAARPFRPATLGPGTILTGAVLARRSVAALGRVRTGPVAAAVAALL
ncbi:hypothetical protein, partial [Methylobacterium sp. WL8]|uniref:hypothetical protein n=1 Tax=Methylobacterium sp. WL8 TaxID=2603899 RepID=UPI001AEE147A